MNSLFVDSNICVYAFDKTDVEKQEKAFRLLKEKPFLSSQVIIETYNACYKKLKLSPSVCEENTLFLCDISRVFEISDSAIRTAVTFKRKYRLSFLDSMIISSAFHAGCAILYSEDLQHNQQIEERLTIVNPFL